MPQEKRIDDNVDSSRQLSNSWTLITQTISDNVVMSETHHSIVDWVCFKIQTWRSWGLKINPQEVCLAYCWKQNICSNKLDVQETNCCFAQFYRVWNHFSGCWIAYGCVTCLWSLGHSDWSSTFTNIYVQPKHTSIQETDSTLHSRAKTQKVKRRQKVDWNEKAWTWAFVKCGLCAHQHTCFSQWISVVIKMIIRGKSPTMRHVSRTHRVALDWLLDRINLEPKIHIDICWHQKPTRWHSDQRKFLKRWVESPSVFVQYDEFLDAFLWP